MPPRRTRVDPKLPPPSAGDNGRRRRLVLADNDAPSDLERVSRERDLYRRLLDLGSCDELEPFLAETLRLVVEILGAHQGYLELTGPAKEGDAPGWWAAHGFSANEIDRVRAAMSRGIIAEAVQTGQTIVTNSALTDSRFGLRESVRHQNIQAVLCAPLGAPPIGFLYLQRRLAPGAFSEAHRGQIETFARHVVPFADRLMVRHLQREACDETKPIREKLRLEGIVGRSAALASVLREVALVAPLDVDVLLTGESGTGKSQIARAIHDNGPRAGRGFVELNCAAIPDSLIESELFGALPGAHSTASRRIDGKVVAAAQGTLFLDEIGELSHSAQAKLLQLLHSRIFYPPGSARPERADLRVIAATNVDLQAAVEAGTFREDLFYRLDVLPIRLPTLAERREDIPDLARYFCAEATARHRLPHAALSEDLIHALQMTEWPGNVRQLSHAVEAAVIRATGTGATQVERAHVFRDPLLGGGPAGAATEDEADRRLTFQEATRRFHADLLRRTFDETGWNVQEAARRLELTRSHVYNLIKAFGLERSRAELDHAEARTQDAYPAHGGRFARSDAGFARDSESSLQGACKVVCRRDSEGSETSDQHDDQQYENHQLGNPVVHRDPPRSRVAATSMPAFGLSASRVVQDFRADRRSRVHPAGAERASRVKIATVGRQPLLSPWFERSVTPTRAPGLHATQAVNPVTPPSFRTTGTPSTSRRIQASACANGLPDGWTRTSCARRIAAEIAGGVSSVCIAASRKRSMSLVVEPTLPAAYQAFRHGRSIVRAPW